MRSAERPLCVCCGHRCQQLAPGGGYGLSSANTVTEYVPLANFNAMREAAFKYGKYPINL